MYTHDVEHKWEPSARLRRLATKQTLPRMLPHEAQRAELSVTLPRKHTQPIVDLLEARRHMFPTKAGASRVLFLLRLYFRDSMPTVDEFVYFLRTRSKTEAMRDLARNHTVGNRLGIRRFNELLYVLSDLLGE